LSDLFCVEAGRRIRDARQQLDAPDEQVDDRRRTVAAAVRAHKGYGVADAILDVPSHPVKPLDAAPTIPVPAERASGT
jgi:hypothetical protein